MNKKLKWFCLAPVIFAASTSLTSCNNSGDDYLILRVINSEDYIYLQESDEDPEDLVIQFEKSDMVKDFLASNEDYSKYKGVKVIYDTSDTNETLYSELQTGKSNYDLMNVSDYMAQKIVAGQMAVPLYRDVNGNIDDPADYDMIPNYQQYASKNIKTRLDEIEAVQKVFQDGSLKERTVKLEDYAVGYMWGTLGILFNPTYPGFADIAEEEAIEDMQSFDALWDSKYNGTISIKNSMRDTYALGLMHAYRDEFQALKEEYEESGDLVTYQTKFAEIFNRCSEKEVLEVQQALEELKKNIFGLEVDSGKQDIITKKIGVNLAWSGDAVYSMDQGEDLEQVSEVVELCYAVPELGSNLWFDAWIMPNCPRSQAQYELAHLFLDFLSDPENANQNMNYTGYTSFIGGDSILELVRDWYDVRTSEIYYGDEYYQIYSLNEETEEVTAIDYPDFLSANRVDASRDEDQLYYYMPTGEESEDFEPTMEDLLNEETGAPVMILDDEGEETEVQKKFADLTIVDAEDSELEAVDLQYFFKDTLNEYEVEDAIFYSDCYLPYENEDGTQNISVGRQFFCQYPNEETLNRCAVMKDYGENNKYVMKMWEQFKSDPLPTWAIIVFVAVIVGILALISYLVVNNIIKKSIKKKRTK